MKFGIVTFPGSNCDYDAFRAVADTLAEQHFALRLQPERLQKILVQHGAAFLRVRAAHHVEGQLRGLGKAPVSVALRARGSVLALLQPND